MTLPLPSPTPDTRDLSDRQLEELVAKTLGLWEPGERAPRFCGDDRAIAKLMIHCKDRNCFHELSTHWVNLTREPGYDRSMMRRAWTVAALQTRRAHR